MIDDGFPIFGIGELGWKRMGVGGDGLRKLDTGRKRVGSAG